MARNAEEQAIDDARHKAWRRRMKSFSGWVIAAMVVLACLLPQGAAATSYVCLFYAKHPPEQVLKACTEDIRAGSIYTAHIGRAVAFKKLGNDVRALRDFEAAIEGLEEFRKNVDASTLDPMPY